MFININPLEYPYNISPYVLIATGKENLKSFARKKNKKVFDPEKKVFALHKK